MNQGRLPSIPATPDVGQWHSEGFGCRRIARLLEERRVYTTKSSVRTHIKFSLIKTTLEYHSLGKSSCTIIP